MIKEVKIYGYEQLKASPRPDEDIYISVLEPGMVNEMFPSRTENILPMQFGDCSGNHMSKECNNGQPGVAPFTVNEARTVIDFINRWHNDPKPVTLHVNCMMGRSRSGAIAFFAWQYCGLDFQEFILPNMAKNPTNPNKHILNTLFRVSNGM